jgi:hypothetical protein
MMMKLPQHNMFVHSACCMTHWYLANLPTGGQALICQKCSTTAGVKVTVLKSAKLERLKIEGEVVPGTFVSACHHRAFELVYRRSGSYKLICEECNSDIVGVKVTGPRMNHCAACGRAKR